MSPEACYETVDHEGDEVCAWGNEDGCVAATTKLRKHPICEYTLALGFVCKNGMKCCGSLSVPRCACDVSSTDAPTSSSEASGATDDDGNANDGVASSNKWYNKIGSFVKEHWVPLSGAGAGVVFLLAGALIMRSARSKSSTSSSKAKKKKKKRKNNHHTALAGVSDEMVLSWGGTVSIDEDDRDRISSAVSEIDMWMENPMALPRPPTRT